MYTFLLSFQTGIHLNRMCLSLRKYCMSYISERVKCGETLLACLMLHRMQSPPHQLIFAAGGQNPMLRSIETSVCDSVRWRHTLLLWCCRGIPERRPTSVSGSRTSALWASTSTWKVPDDPLWRPLLRLRRRSSDAWLPTLRYTICWQGVWRPLFTAAWT